MNVVICFKGVVIFQDTKALYILGIVKFYQYIAVQL